MQNFSLDAASSFKEMGKWEKTVSFEARDTSVQEFIFARINNIVFEQQQQKIYGKITLVDIDLRLLGGLNERLLTDYVNVFAAK